MRIVKNVIGQKFGKLTVTEQFTKSSELRNDNCCLCSCECGNNKEILTTQLINNQIKSCGCLRAKFKIGTIFGKLTVLKVFSKNGIRFAECECECGKIKDIRTYNLISRNTKTCGCENAGKKPFGESAKNQVIQEYIRSAKDRNLEYKLSRDMALELFSKNCFYCHEPPSNLFVKKRGNGGFTYNGIDRFDNNKGYTLENCVTCCKMCNFMKGTMNGSEFINKCNKITKFHGDVNVN